MMEVKVSKNRVFLPELLSYVTMTQSLFNNNRQHLLMIANTSLNNKMIQVYE